MFDLLTSKVLEITRQRLLGIPLKQIILDNPELAMNDDESQLNYGDQGKSYYFDYGIGVVHENIRGIEGCISEDTFKICEYTSINSNSFHLDISHLPSKMNEAEFFQFSLVADIMDLSVEQLNAVLEIRDIIRENKIDWGVK